MNKKRSIKRIAFDVSMGQRITKARLEAGIAQHHLAAILGVTNGPIQHIERGRNGVSASQLWTISCATGKPIDWFFE